MCHVSCVMCHVSHDIMTPKRKDLGTWYFETMFITPCVLHVMRHVSCVLFHMSCVNCHVSQISGASWWSVCYQWSLPCIVWLVKLKHYLFFLLFSTKKYDYIFTHNLLFFRQGCLTLPSLAVTRPPPHLKAYFHSQHRTDGIIGLFPSLFTFLLLFLSLHTILSAWLAAN